MIVEETVRITVKSTGAQITPEQLKELLKQIQKLNK